uniref:Uncharacterized protein n=1 Tax=Cacopsylla melanoneura TaxID=428564 RepID=A0A8D8Y073_9HEMI
MCLDIIIMYLPIISIIHYVLLCTILKQLMEGGRHIFLFLSFLFFILQNSFETPSFVIFFIHPDNGHLCITKRHASSRRPIRTARYSTGLQVMSHCENDNETPAMSHTIPAMPHRVDIHCTSVQS